jgi:hypothetical protein
MLEDKKHWAKVNRRAQTMLLLAGLRRVIVPHVKLEFSHFVYYGLKRCMNWENKKNNLTGSKK